MRLVKAGLSAQIENQLLPLIAVALNASAEPRCLFRIASDKKTLLDNFIRDFEHSRAALVETCCKLKDTLQVVPQYTNPILRRR